jgi:hypothetical protein
MNIKEAIAAKKEETIVKPTIYRGVYRMVDQNAVPILREGDVYKPNSAEQVAFLEEQVKRGLITKE